MPIPADNGRKDLRRRLLNSSRLRNEVLRNGGVLDQVGRHQLPSAFKVTLGAWTLYGRVDGAVDATAATLTKRVHTRVHARALIPRARPRSCHALALACTTHSPSLIPLARPRSYPSLALAHTTRSPWLIPLARPCSLLPLPSQTSAFSATCETTMGERHCTLPRSWIATPHAKPCSTLAPTQVRPRGGQKECEAGGEGCQCPVPLWFAPLVSSAFLFHTHSCPSTGYRDNSGDSILNAMVVNMPAVAGEALDSFSLIDRPARKQRHYLSLLEPSPSADVRCNVAGGFSKPPI